MACRVEVTEEDIENGKRGDPACCPLALAMKRCLNFKSCEVHNGHIKYVNSFDRAGEITLDGGMASFVARYDEQGEMSPRTLFIHPYGPEELGIPVPEQYPSTRP